MHHEKLTTVTAVETPFALEGIVRKLPDGRLFLTYTTGGSYEPCEENITCSLESTNGGKSWSEPTILFSHPRKGTFTPGLFAENGSIHAFPGTYTEMGLFSQEYEGFHSVSEDGGRTFQSPKSLPGGYKGMHVKCCREYDGMWYLAVSWLETDGELWTYPRGEKPSVVGGKRQVAAVTTWGWENTCNTEYCGVLISRNKGESWTLCGRIGHKGLSCVEPMLTKKRDGTLVMLLRVPENWIYKSESTDGGMTWSEPEQTELPSAISKCCLLTDSDGVHYLLFNPNPAARNPLALWVSRDDMVSWDKRYTLLYSANPKDVMCYPDGFLDEERRMVCFSWEDRKNIYYSEFPMEKK